MPAQPSQFSASLVPADAVRRRDSLRTRLALWSSLAMATLMVAVALGAYLAMRAELVADAKDRALMLADQTVRTLEANMDPVQAIGRSLAASGSGVSSEPANLRALLYATLAGDPDIAGAMLIVQPGLLRPDDPGFDWYVRRSGQALVEKSMEDLGYDYRSRPWYVRTMAARGPWWSEPYANAATAGQVFTTYNLPLRAPGAAAGQPAIGMVSVDVPVSRLSGIVQQLPHSPGLQPQLYTPDGALLGNGDPRAPRTRLAQLVLRGRTELAPLAAARVRGLPVQYDYAQGRRRMIGMPVADSGWYLSVAIDQSYFLQGLNQVAMRVALAGLVGVLLSLWLVRRYARRIAGPLEDLSKSARELSQGNFETPLPHTARRDEVGVLARTLDRARRSIRQQLADIRELGNARQKVESELAIARDIQLAMLPPPCVMTRGEARLEAHAVLEAAKAVGGDFYSFIERDDGALWFAIGDVSDKGVPAALFMARSMAVLEATARTAASPDRVLAEASRRLVEGNETCMFATVLCGHIDVRSGHCTLASAGHEGPWLLHADGRVETPALQPGPPLGFEVSSAFPLWHGVLPPGASLLTCTDGVTEAFDPQQQAYGGERLHAALRPGYSARENCERLIADVHAFAGAAPQSDDITVLAIRRDAPAHPHAPADKESRDADTTDRPR